MPRKAKMQILIAAVALIMTAAAQAQTTDPPSNREVQKNEQVRKLRGELSDLQEKRQALLQRFTPEWPEVKQIDAQIRTKEEDLKRALRQQSLQSEQSSLTSSQFTYANPVEIYLTLKPYRSRLQKDQFETTEDFKKRLQSLLPQLRVGRNGAAERFGFKVLADNQEYDADTQTFSFSLPNTLGYDSLMGLEIPEELIENFDRAETAEELAQDEFTKRLRKIRLSNFLRVQLSKSRRVLGSRVGKTAMGVSFRYTIASYTSMDLVMRKTNLYSVRQKFRLVLPTEVARKTVGNLAIGIVGRLRFPFFSEFVGYDVAKLSDPEESHYTEFFLYLEPDALIFFDKGSGEALSSLSLPLKLPQENDDSILLNSIYSQPNSHGANGKSTALTDREKPALWIILKTELD